MLRLVVACVALAPLSVLVSSCGGDDAVEECEAERELYLGTDKASCMNDATFEACITCHDDCGNSCGTVDTACPFTYSCPR